MHLSTAAVIEAALAGSRLTDGWYDPTCGRELAAAGYRRSFEGGWSLALDPGPRQARSHGIEVDTTTGLLDIPAGIAIDLGGIGKGRAADAAGHPRVAVVVAATAAGAEMLATASAIAPLDAAIRIITRAGATAWLVHADGALTTVGTPARFILDDGWLSSPAHRRWAP